MFSSTTSPNLFPNLPPPYAFLGGDGTDFILHHSDLLMADTLFGMVVSNKSPVRNQEACSEPINYEQNFGPESMLTKEKKAAANKQHKHSKIFTAQGLRDRRVRLSIEAARKFFDLQDMLGFEKASKTIDWLLKNSKAEIKELMKKSSLTSPAPGCGVLVSGNHDEGTKMMKKLMKSSAVGKGKEVKLQKDRAGFDDRYLASREARARARERARERTREKKMLRSDQLKGSPIFHFSSIEQKLSEDNFKSNLYELWKGPATSRANGNIV